MRIIDQKPFNALQLLFLLFLTSFNLEASPIMPGTLISDTKLPIVINGKACGSISLKAGTLIFIKDLNQSGVVISQGTDSSLPTFQLEVNAVDPQALTKFQAAALAAKATPTPTTAPTATPSPTPITTASAGRDSSSKQAIWEQGMAPQLSPGTGQIFECNDVLSSPIFRPEKNK